MLSKDELVIDDDDNESITMLDTLTGHFIRVYSNKYFLKCLHCAQVLD